MSHRSLYRFAAVAALALMPGSALAQRADAWIESAPRGWIGITLSVNTETGPDGTRRTVVITDVNDGGPAGSAGLRTGDVLLRINEIRDPDGFENINERLPLHPGDPVHVVYLRNGRLHELDMIAADRSGPVPPPVLTLHFQPDSMVETAFRTMNSLRVRLVQSRGRSVAVAETGGLATEAVAVGADTRLAPLDRVSEPARPDARWRFPEPGEVSRRWVTQEVQAPFAFFVFRGEQHDSLQREMDELNSLFRELRAREGERQRDLMRMSGTLRGNENDSQLLRIRGTLEELSERSSRLRKAMEESAVSTAGNRYATSFSSRGVPERDAPPEPRADFRPLAPYLLGQNRAAGAEVIDMRPGLAEAFMVDGGVFVVDVPDGTPAAAAGIRAGDVITRVDDVPVRSVLGLRTALSRAHASIRLTLVRRGESRTVLLGG